jgi:hypothetical protein
MPSLREFIDHAVAHGCKYFDFQGAIIGPRGEVKIRCLKGNRNIIAPLPDMGDNDVLTPTVLRSLCNRLALDLSHFGIQ